MRGSRPVAWLLGIALLAGFPTAARAYLTNGVPNSWVSMAGARSAEGFVTIDRPFDVLRFMTVSTRGTYAGWSLSDTKGRLIAYSVWFPKLQRSLSGIPRRAGYPAGSQIGEARTATGKPRPPGPSGGVPSLETPTPTFPAGTYRLALITDGPTRLTFLVKSWATPKQLTLNRPYAAQAVSWYAAPASPGTTRLPVAVPEGYQLVRMVGMSAFGPTIAFHHALCVTRSALGCTRPEDQNTSVSPNPTGGTVSGRVFMSDRNELAGGGTWTVRFDHVALAQSEFSQLYGVVLP